MSLLLVFIMVSMLCVTAFASEGEVEDIADAVDVIEAPVEEAVEDVAEVAEAPAEASAPARSNSGAFSTLIWGVVLVGICVILLIVSNNKIKKGKKGAK